MSPGLPELSGGTGLTSPDDPGVTGNTEPTGFTGEIPIPAGDTDIEVPIGAIDKLEAVRGEIWLGGGAIPGGVKLVIVHLSLVQLHMVK